LGFTVAFRVADVCVTDEADPVVTVGAFGNVFNVASPPWLAPPPFAAVTLKWYVVFASRLSIAPDTDTALVPEPGLGEHATLDP
jgi:hypothetical protein